MYSAIQNSCKWSLIGGNFWCMSILNWLRNAKWFLSYRTYSRVVTTVYVWIFVYLLDVFYIMHPMFPMISLSLHQFLVSGHTPVPPCLYTKLGPLCQVCALQTERRGEIKTQQSNRQRVSGSWHHRKIWTLPYLTSAPHLPFYVSDGPAKRWVFLTSNFAENNMQHDIICFKLSDRDAQGWCIKPYGAV